MIRPEHYREYTFGICRIAIGAIFIIASADKILEPEQFAAVIHSYALLPDSLINLFALFLPWFELTVGAAFVASRKYRNAAATAIVMMLAMFCIAVSINLVRGSEIGCGCFHSGEEQDPISIANVFRNLVMMGITLAVLWYNMSTLARPQKPA